MIGVDESRPFEEIVAEFLSRSIEGNSFYGQLPPELGNLVNIERLPLSANEFTGELPAALAKLTNLTDLRTSDLRGNGSAFPELSSMKSLKTLILRNTLSGEIPTSFAILRKCRLYDPESSGTCYTSASSNPSSDI
uniref:LRR receptor-like serine/threonine-protein kinase n=1 Tax=Ananas comosus var. bracteatus TaxID=296719 RepID=A0A6V7PZR9_ANACO|nr:unnamed protein product [Ananas comosus var. bracteatus]